MTLTHGEASASRRTPEYRAWYHIKDRCLNPRNKMYAYYGGRGITVCDRWFKFNNFLEDIGRRPSKSHSIDRIDNNKGYYKENCRWATRGQQAFNRRSNRIITAFGSSKPLTVWARETGLHYVCIQFRLKRGWTPEQALGVPKDQLRGVRGLKLSKMIPLAPLQSLGTNDAIRSWERK